MGKAGSADPSVLREMLKQGTDREFTEATDAKMESRSKAQEAENQTESLREQQDIYVDESKENMDPAQTSTRNPQKSVPATEITCKSCAAPLQTDWKVCPSCGTHSEHRCTNCSTALQVEWNNCPQCGLINPNPNIGNIQKS